MTSFVTRFAWSLMLVLACTVAQAAATTEILSGAGFDELARQHRGQPLAVHVHRRPPAGEAASSELEAVAARILKERGIQVDPAAEVQIVIDPSFYVATDRFVARDTPLCRIHVGRGLSQRVAEAATVRCTDQTVAHAGPPPCRLTDSLPVP